MTDIVSPSYRANGSSYETSGVIALGGASDGYVQPGASPTDMATQSSINEAALDTFSQTSSGSSLTVTINEGEAFVNGTWVARDTTTDVLLDASTNNQTVYVGYQEESKNLVTIGKSSDFDAADRKISIWEFDTDGSGVTSSTDLRRTDRVVDAVASTIDSERNLLPEGQQTGLAADSTGIKYEGEMRQLIDSRLLDDPRSVYIEASTNSSHNDEDVTVEIYDDDAATVVDSLVVSGGSTRSRSVDISGSLTAGNEVHVRFNVTSASGTGGATFDVNGARLIVE